jgi:hypothetical protein
VRTCTQMSSAARRIPTTPDTELAMSPFAELGFALAEGEAEAAALPEAAEAAEDTVAPAVEAAEDAGLYKREDIINDTGEINSGPTSRSRHW